MADRGTTVVATSDYDMGALVFDLGRRSFRFGPAGDDGPSFELPSRVGYFPGYETAEERNEELLAAYHKNGSGVGSPALNDDLGSGTDNAIPAKHRWNAKKYRFCRYPITQLPPLDNLEVKPYLSSADACVVDWDAFENVLHYVFTDCLRQNSSTSPMLFCETAVSNPTTQKAREKLAELVFEKFRAPALCLCRAPVLSCFANGKTSGLVLDLGADSSTCTPVHEGFSLFRQYGMQTPVGGTLLTEECRHLFESGSLCPKMGEIVPQYQIASKESVGVGVPPKFMRRNLTTKPTTTYHRAMVDAVVDDFKHSCVRVSDGPLRDVNPATIPMTEYEFPNGYRHEFMMEGTEIGEALIDPSRFSVIQQRGGEPINSMLGISNIVMTVLSKMEPDLRSHIGNTLIVTGGQAAIPGLIDRLQREVLTRQSGVKLKVMPNTSDSRERVNAPWIGGSILGSLSSFHSLWYTRQDYEAGEGRMTTLHKKCP